MARFLREQFMNTQAECDWLRATYLKGVDVPPFSSFTIVGSNDSPARVDLYTPKAPEYNTRPCAVVEQGMDSDLIVTVAEAKKAR